MEDIIARIEALLANTPQSEIEEFEVTRCLRDCRDEIIAARACAEMMLQGTGQRLAEGMAERVINGQAIGAWIPVSERLPERNKMVCVVCEGHATVGTYSPMMLDWWAMMPFTSNMVPTRLVTHWMPLPEPPEE